MSAKSSLPIFGSRAGQNLFRSTTVVQTASTTRDCSSWFTSTLKVSRMSALIFRTGSHCHAGADRAHAFADQRAHPSSKARTVPHSLACRECIVADRHGLRNRQHAVMGGHCG